MGSCTSGDAAVNSGSGRGGGSSGSASGSGAAAMTTVSVPVVQRGGGNNSSHQQSNGAPLVARQLTLSPNYRHGSNITQAELDRQRAEYWNTRTEGNRLMWQTIRTAADAMVSGDLPLARAILEASSIITTTGTLEVCYDERGAQYKVPIYCYANPIELRGENPLPGSSIAQEIPHATSVASADKKTVVDAKPLKLRIRVNPGDINFMVNADTGYSIAELKRCIVQESTQSAVAVPDLEEDRQRIIFMGRELQNPQVLGEIGLDESKVVQVFLRPKP